MAGVFHSSGVSRSLEASSVSAQDLEDVGGIKKQDYQSDLILFLCGYYKINKTLAFAS